MGLLEALLDLKSVKDFFGKEAYSETRRGYPATFYNAISLGIKDILSKIKKDDRSWFERLRENRKIGVAELSYLEDGSIDSILFGGDFGIDESVIRAAIKSHGKDKNSNYMSISAYTPDPKHFSTIYNIIDLYIHEKNPLKGKIIDIYGNELDFGDLDWKDIAIPDSFKLEVVQNIIWPVKYPEKIEAANLRAGRGVMLEGGRGMGKTLLSKIIANQIKGQGTFIKALPSDIQRLEWDYVFEVARTLEPSVLYIEDIDAFTPTERTPNMSAFLSDLLDYLDGTEERGKVTILTSTNDPTSIDERIIDRPGRTDRRLEFNPKDEAFGYKWREDVLEIHLKGFRLEEGLSTHTIASMFRDTPYTGSHIKELIHTAMLEALERKGIEKLKLEEIKDKVYLTKDDFEKAVPRVKILTEA